MPRHALVLLLFLIAACAPTVEPTQVALVYAPNRILGFWETVRDTVDPAFQGQPWQFVGAGGDAVRLVLTSQSANITLTVQRADGTVLDGGNDVRVTLPEDGVYTALVRVAPGETRSYALSLEYTDRPDPSKPTATPTPTRVPTITPTPTLTPTATPPYAALGTFAARLSPGTPHDAVFSRADEQHVYLFDGTAGQFVTIRMARITGTLDPAVWLYDPNGSPVAADDNTGGEGAALLRNILLAQTGEYTVQALGDGRSGDYRIGITSAASREPVQPSIPEPTATPTASPTPAPREDRLVDHVPVLGRVASAGDFARFPIVALEGEVFTIGVSPIAGSALRPEIQLYSPLGELVTSATASASNAGGDAVIPAYRASLSGTYVALVQDEADATGDYIIAYGLGSSRENVIRGTANADTPTTGDITRRGLRDVWSIYLNRDDVITATVNPQSATFDPALDMVAPDGTVIASDDNSAGGRVPLINSIRAPQSGMYALRVTGANASSSGVYSLVWRYVVAAPTATPPAATIMILSADDTVPERTYVDYPFQGQAGQRILIRVRAGEGSALDPVVALMTLDGTTLARADDNGTDLNPLLEFILPVDGTYVARVDGYQSSGAFDLTVEALY